MSFRTDTRAGVMTVLNAYKTANAGTPAQLRRVNTARPASQEELPCAWIDSIDATQIRHYQGLRFDDLLVSVVLADNIVDSTEEVIRADALVDALEDALTAGYHAINGQSILEPISYRQTLITEGPVNYAGTEFLLRATQAVGRI